MIGDEELSCKDKIVAWRTLPQIGNVGISRVDVEAHSLVRACSILVDSYQLESNHWSGYCDDLKRCILRVVEASASHRLTKRGVTRLACIIENHVLRQISRHNSRHV